MKERTYDVMSTADREIVHLRLRRATRTRVPGLDRAETYSIDEVVDKYGAVEGLNQTLERLREYMKKKEKELP